MTERAVAGEYREALFCVTELRKVLDSIGFPYEDETDNPAGRFFLR